jgi:3-deoxy-D-arabino-heptulosonate 7-phosphate (DAHP) synthase class II
VTPTRRENLKAAGQALFMVVVLVVLLVLSSHQRHGCAAAGGHLERTGRTTTHCVNDDGEEVGP